jgi:hypothetical protein
MQWKRVDSVEKTSFSGIPRHSFAALIDRGIAVVLLIILHSCFFLRLFLFDVALAANPQ